MAPRLVDTNIFLRYFTGTPPDQAQRARRLLGRIERGEERAVTTVMVLFEVVFTLHRTYKMPKPQIEQMVGDIVVLPGLDVAGKDLFLRALALFAETSLSFADAFNAVFMQHSSITEIYSWDTDFDRVPGITRVEPEAGS